MKYFASSVSSAYTNQFSRSFIPFYSNLWNTHPNQVAQYVDLEHFKAALNKFNDTLSAQGWYYHRETSEHYFDVTYLGCPLCVVI